MDNLIPLERPDSSLLPQIVTAPHPALKRAAPLCDDCLGADVVDTIAALEQLLAQTGSICLSAPMIGRSLRFFVVGPSLAGGEVPTVFINPVVLATGSQHRRSSERCLSVRGKVRVNRATRVTVQARNARGELFTIEAGDGPAAIRDSNKIDPAGLYARVIQHEVDHLNGILTLDRRG